MERINHWTLVALGMTLVLTACTSTPAPSPETDTSATTPVAVETNQVSYGTSGFSPATIKVQQGETVIFTNGSARSMQPASDVHPTHQEYPTNTDSTCDTADFDACSAIESYQFTFSEVGEWTYHNHLRPTDTGTIIVE